MLEALHAADPSNSEEEIELTLEAAFPDRGAFQRECRSTLATSHAEFLGNSNAAPDAGGGGSKPPLPGAAGQPQCEAKEAAKMAKKCARAVAKRVPSVQACFSKSSATAGKMQLCKCLAMAPMVPCLGECRSRALQFVCGERTTAAVLSLWDIDLGDNTPLCVTSLVAARFEGGAPAATVTAPAAAIGSTGVHNGITVPSASAGGSKDDDGDNRLRGVKEGSSPGGAEDEEEGEGGDVPPLLLHYSTQNGRMPRGRGQGESSGEVKRTEPVPAWLSEPLASMLHPESNPTSVFTVEELLRRAKAYSTLNRRTTKKQQRQRQQQTAAKMADANEDEDEDEDDIFDDDDDDDDDDDTLEDGSGSAGESGMFEFTEEHEIVAAMTVGRLIELGIIAHAAGAEDEGLRTADEL